MGALRSLLGLITLSLLVKQSPHRPSRVLHPRLQRSPPWTLRRQPSSVSPPNTPDVPKPATELPGWEGVGDPGYLLAEIEELRSIAQRSGLGTLAHLLDCAAAEARAQVALKREHDETRRALTLR